LNADCAEAMAAAAHRRTAAGATCPAIVVEDAYAYAMVSG
jgi:hypothetical protein